jgi:hypothetical protein
METKELPKCPFCGENRGYTENQDDLSAHTPVLGLCEGEEDFEYGNSETEGGYISNYVCDACGEVVADHRDAMIDFLKGIKI